MGKKYLNKKQKKILYKNIGVLLALIVFCAIFARSDLFGGGETLEDLAQKQVQETAPPAEKNSEIPDRESSPPEEKSELPEEKSEPLRREPKLPEEEPEDIPAKDRTTYSEGFYYEPLNDTVKERITGISYPADDSEAAISYDTLRYVNVLYYDFDGNVQNGELICHKAIAQDLLEIFYELYNLRYPIEKICLVDEYQGDDSLSMQDNNTSCFNYRALPSGRLSNHAYGLAIDLNPFYNPYVTRRGDGSVNIAPAGSELYADRSQSFAYKIDPQDPAFVLFTQHGFTWGGNWRSSKDYQHFEKEI